MFVACFTIDLSLYYPVVHELINNFAKNTHIGFCNNATGLIPRLLFIISILSFFFFLFVYLFSLNTKFPFDSKFALKQQLHSVETVLYAQTARAKQQLKSWVSENQFHIQTASVTAARHFLLTNDKWHHCCCRENSLLTDQ